MNEINKNEVIVRAILEGGLSQVEAAHRFGVSTRWIRTLLTRYHRAGLPGLGPVLAAHTPTLTRPVRPPAPRSCTYDAP